MDADASKEYEVQGVIGSGSFGLIRKVVRKRDNMTLVRKEIHYLKMSEREKQQLTQEVNILAGLKHPHIVRYYSREIAKEEGMVYLYMEYCHNGDLGSVIKHCKQTGEFLPEKLMWSILTQLLLALHYCHTGGADPPILEGSLSQNSNSSSKPTGQIVLHRDIKPENIFLDENNTIKLGDFGLSRTLSSHEIAFAQTYVGTPYYMSPEIISSLPYTHASDMWALGCVLYELMTHSPPFTAKTQMGLFQKIKEGVFAPMPRDRRTGARLYSTDIEEVIRACLRSNPGSRPSAEELLGCEHIAQCRRQREIDSLHAELKLQHMSISTRESAIQQRENTLLSREAAVAEREIRLTEREGRLLQKEKWGAELVEREKLIHERERIVHEREQRLERLTREYEDKMDIEMVKDHGFVSPQSPPRRPLQENNNRPEMPRFQTAPAACSSYPPPAQHYTYIHNSASENSTLNTPPVPIPPKSPSRLQLTAQTFLSPRRRRTTLGSPSRQANPALSPSKSSSNLRAVAESPRKVATITRGERTSGMIKLAARNTFKGRENEVVDWDKECEQLEMEMPSPFIRRRGMSRISGGFSSRKSNQ